MAVPRLDALPTEVLGHITHHLEVGACLCLGQTCRAIRHATHDALVLRDVISSQHILWNFHSLNLIRIARRLNYDAKILERYHVIARDQRRLGQWDKAAFNDVVQQHFGLDVDTWIRYALADSRAFHLCAELNCQVDENGRGKFGFASNAAFDKAMGFLPHLLTLKHPSIHASGLAPALAMQIIKAINDGCGEVDSAVSDRLAFCYCATMLSQDTPEAPLLGASNARAAINAFFTSRCRDFANRLKASAIPSSDVLSPHAHRQTTRMTQAEAQIIIGAFSSLLRHAFREYRVRRLIDVPMDHNRSRLRPSLPFSDRQPDHVRTWEEWHADQIEEMTSYEFLATGPWVGCYSLNVHPSVPEIDAPMMDIEFDFTAGGATEDDATVVHATGKDSIGVFRLDGFVERSGHVSLSKSYEHGKRWEWNCQMTPFGIGGVWGPPNSDLVNGSVWLWKKGWTEARKR
ncbi:MAG: hypothetical protein Q9159_003317 [Coniocarpon cinnabarinum]